ncbi:hypothetical protein ACJMK2_040611, partial [Sinanodonta woodiana]
CCDSPEPSVDPAGFQVSNPRGIFPSSRRAPCVYLGLSNLHLTALHALFPLSNRGGAYVCTAGNPPETCRGPLLCHVNASLISIPHSSHIHKS